MSIFGERSDDELSRGDGAPNTKQRCQTHCGCSDSNTTIWNRKYVIYSLSGSTFPLSFSLLLAVFFSGRKTDFIVNFSLGARRTL